MSLFVALSPSISSDLCAKFFDGCAHHTPLARLALTPRAYSVQAGSGGHGSAGAPMLATYLISSPPVGRKD